MQIYFCTYSCCQYRSNQSSHPLALPCLACDPIPWMAHGGPAGGQSNICPFPFSLLQNGHLLCRGSEDFPRTVGNECMGCLWSPLTPGFCINLFARRKMQFFFHSVNSGEDVHPTPCSTAPLSVCPVWIHTSWTIQGVKVLAICLQVHQQTHKSAWLQPGALHSLSWSPTAPRGKDLSYPSKCTYCD